MVSAPLDLLWLKVADEVGIPSVLSSEEETSLALIFDAENSGSAWSLAIARLGFRQPWHLGPVLRFVGGVPFFNGSLLAAITSQGTIVPRRGENDRVIYESKLGLFGIFRMMHAHWRLEVFLRSEEPIADPIEESIALGLAIQSLSQRLPAKGELDTAAWLADPTSAPAPLRPTIEKILRLQRRRNSLSPAWKTLFPDLKPRPADGQESSLPAHFWNEPAALKAQENPQTESFLGRTAKGIPISSGKASGRLILVEGYPAILPAIEGPLVLLFPKARPETTELFPQAIAVVYGEGGALSHACSIAREQGMVCVSGLGKNLVKEAHAWLNAGKIVYAEVDGTTGELLCLEKPS
jgi:phosphohistidine swiveling domain-containing protein